MPYYLIVFLLIVSTSLEAAIDPIYKDCLQRGYSINGDSCVFPDGSMCSLKNFNAQECGQAFYDIDYCVGEGSYVWDSDACCKGLKPYLPKGISGQSVCRTSTYVVQDRLSGSGLFYLLLFVVLAVVATIFYRKRKNE